MELKNQLSIIQNFILFPNNEEKLKLLQSEIGIKATSKVLKDCNFYVNYKTTLFIEEIKQIYKKKRKKFKPIQHTRWTRLLF